MYNFRLYMYSLEHRLLPSFKNHTPKQAVCKGFPPGLLSSSSTSIQIKSIPTARPDNLGKQKKSRHVLTPTQTDFCLILIKEILLRSRKHWLGSPHPVSM